MSNFLFRKVQNGGKYNALIPNSACEKVAFGEGDTYLSVQLILKQILQHNWQLEKVAKLLDTYVLEETLSKIHSFAYNHFQYKADGKAQLLRSPACAWKTRYDGIDCKSYTIIVGCLLTQLGLRYYIRKIKQPTFEPEDFTHVYVIVPVNQQTGTIQDGYYTIDATLPTMVEPIFIDSNDTYMDKLPHYGLNGLASSGTVYNPPTTTTGTTTTDTQTTDSGSSSGSFFKNWNWDMFDGWFKGPIDCWGGSAFSGDKVEESKKRAMDIFNDILNNINIAAKKGDMVELSRLEYTFRGLCATVDGAWDIKSLDSWNSCTDASIDNMRGLADSVINNILVPLTAWFDYYYDRHLTGQAVAFNSHDTEVMGFYFTWTDPAYVWNSPVSTFTPKPLTEPIKAFEWSPYLESVAQGQTAFNIQDYIKGIQSILVTVQSSTGGNSTNPTDGGTTDAGGTTQKAGFGILGFVLTAAAVGLAVKGMSGSGTSKKSNSTKNATRVTTPQNKKSNTKKSK